MRARDAAGVAALAAACILIVFAFSELRRRVLPESPPAAPMPSSELVIAVGGGNLGASLALLDDSPFWSGVLRSVAAGRRFAPAAPGAVGLYLRGWLVIGAGPAPDTPPASGSDGPWTASASAHDRLPGEASPRIAVPLPDEGAAIVWTPGTGSSSLTARAWRGAFPIRVDGRLDKGSRRESWRLACGASCLLDALRSPASAEAWEGAWSVLPSDPVAASEVAFDPERLSAALDLTNIEDLERFTDIPLRRELAQVLAGRAAVAIVEEPEPGEGAAIVAVFDLASVDRARALVERTLALGVLSGEVVVERYRDVTVGAWRRAGGRTELRPAVAIDGNLLIVAARKRDLLAAIDRARGARRASSRPRAAIESLGPAPWRGWSRSSFLRTEWLEIVTGRRAEGVLPSEDISARIVRRRSGWVLEGDGAGPAFCAEPVLPAARSLLRAVRERP